MEITQVTVNIHEKRNHPHEYGHYDASVTLVAEVAPDEAFGEVVVSLREQARTHVSDECDLWIREIEEERRVERLIGNIQYSIRGMNIRDQRLSETKAALRVIHKLPPYMQDYWREKVSLAFERTKPKPADNASDNLDEEDDDIAF